MLPSSFFAPSCRHWPSCPSQHRQQGVPDDRSSRVSSRRTRPCIRERYAPAGPRSRCTESDEWAGRHLFHKLIIRFLWARRVPTFPFGESIDVFHTFGRVNYLVVRQVINLMLVHPLLIHNPRCVRQDLIRPTAVSNGLASLRMRHRRGRLVLGAQLVRVYTNQKVHVRERQFGLTQLESMSTFVS
jgi:hypothetical protein